MKPTVLLRPIVTEKSITNMKDNWYTFEVAPHATKDQIRQTVERLFTVNVVNISVFIRKGKTKRAGKLRQSVRRESKKFARVQLTQGQKIDVFTVSPESAGGAK